MALPHLPNACTNRRYRAEEVIGKRRDQESQIRNMWQNHTSYFNTESVRATKHAGWTSERQVGLSKSTDSAGVSIKEARIASLGNRRQKLEEVLTHDNLLYQAELRGLSMDNVSRLGEMKRKVDSFQHTKEEERKSIADAKLYEHFRKNSPDLRQLESRQHNKAVISKWGNQMKEKQEAAEKEAEKETKYAEELQRAEAAFKEADHRAQELKREQEKEVMTILHSQMAELAERENEASMLKREQDSLEAAQRQLEVLEEQREREERERAKQNMGNALLRQHAAHMRRKAKQVQQELEKERVLLEHLAADERTEITMVSARREAARADAKWMKGVIEEQLRVEAEREAELDMLYQEEAARLWEKRDEEWRLEKEARERLMNEVLHGRQDQLREQLEEVKERQKESLRQREALVEDMERAHQLTRREKELEENERRMRKEALEGQITSRRDDRNAAAEMALRDVDREAYAQRHYEDMLQEEAAQMNLSGYQLPQHHVKKQAWM